MHNLTIGVLGGGQLGRMLWECSLPWDVNLRFLEPALNSPVARAGAEVVQGDFRSYEDVYRFGKACNVVGIEIEQVNTEALLDLERDGILCIPSAAHIALMQDKSRQKQLFIDLSIPTAPFEILPSGCAPSALPFPYFLKLCKGGYDGYGVMRISEASRLKDAFQEPCIAESLADIEREFAVMLTRNEEGNVDFFPVVSMDFHPVSNMVQWVRYPSGLSVEIEKQAKNYLMEIAEKLDYKGVLAAEFFLLGSGEIWINELAPRPHNSMHITQDLCNTSQFNQYLRLLAGHPPAFARPISGAGLMINLNGSEKSFGSVCYSGLEQVIAMNGAYLHLYGKTQVKPYRKMGHVNLIGTDLEEISANGKKLLHLLRADGEAG
jgi:5-(carboxyamino)imidazole ribonucleotide synthase